MIPTLTHVADFLVEVGAPITIGETAQGLRRWFRLSAAPFGGRGSMERILNAGADFQVIGPDGFTRLEARYVARLDDESMVYIENAGVRFGPPAAMASITRGEPVDPAEVYFRSAPRFETAARAHQWLMRPLFIASGARHPDRVTLRSLRSRLGF